MSFEPSFPDVRGQGTAVEACLLHEVRGLHVRKAVLAR
jgi:hypothetical protein